MNSEKHLKNIFKDFYGSSLTLTNTALVTTYKAFVRSNLDYGNVRYDQAFNNSFHTKMKSIRYSVCQAITGAIRGTLREKYLPRIRPRVPSTLSLLQKTFIRCLFYKGLNINDQNTFLISLM